MENLIQGSAQKCITAMQGIKKPLPIRVSNNPLNFWKSWVVLDRATSFF